MKRIISILVAIALVSCASSNNKDISGQWHGSIELQGVELPLIINIKKEGGDYVATMDSPKQGATGIPVKTVKFIDNMLTIDVPDISFTYEGELKEDGTVAGSLTQSGQKYTMNLTKQQGEVASVPNRPQEPQPPYPYISEDVKFRNESAGFNLAGTITIPKGEGKYPAVVLVSGSGSQNRNEELLGHKPFLVLSDYLSRNGIAVLRYDDRGFAESEGDASTATTADFVTDAMAGVDYLKSRKEVNPKQIGIIGHSEGGTIAFMIAAKEKDVAFAVSMAGTAIRGDSILILQNEASGRAIGVSEEELAEVRKLNRAAYDVILNTDDEKDIEEKLTALLGTSDNMKKVIRTMLSSWMRFFIKYDPAIDIPNIHIPILALFGGKDVQVFAEPNSEAFAKNIPSTNKDAEIKIYPDKNHLFQHAQTGLTTEYESIEETISPEVLQDIADWIKKVTK